MPRHSDFIIQIDSHIGQRIHELRISMGLSRQQLASQIGVTHQQLQKYEKGTNRISVGRLIFIAKVLKEPLTYFLQDLGNIEEVIPPTQHQRMCIEIARSFMKISNPAHQIAANNLVRVLADKEQKDD